MVSGHTQFLFQCRALIHESHILHAIFLPLPKCNISHFPSSRTSCFSQPNLLRLDCNFVVFSEVFARLPNFVTSINVISSSIHFSTSLIKIWTNTDPKRNPYRTTLVLPFTLMWRHYADSLKVFSQPLMDPPYHSAFQIRLIPCREYVK